jgi:hypothetical protein
MIYTIGHSNKGIGDLIATLGDIPILADIRSHPTSRLEDFRYEFLSETLPKYGKQYVWIKDMGGWHSESICPAIDGLDISAYKAGKFPKHHIAATIDANGTPSWTSRGLWDYQFYMITAEFITATHKLVSTIGREQDVAIMCCEYLWWKCHRSMVADYITYCYGVPVYHLQPKLTPHSPDSGSPSRVSRYDRRVMWVWDNIRDRVHGTYSIYGQ